MGEERENMTGKKLKKFSFLKKLGSGSFGTVYEAIQEKTKKVVAVKVISKMQMKQIPKLNELVYS
jgi:serine/threonine protein kinase